MNAEANSFSFISYAEEYAQRTYEAGEYRTYTKYITLLMVYRQTMGNKPLLFGGGSPDMSNSEDLTGVQFINGPRPGNPQLVELAKRQVGNVGGLSRIHI